MTRDRTAMHCTQYRVSFGDCDPAAIVYYPNIFRWVDGTFQDWLRAFGGHAALCARLGAVGLGLMDVRARFRSPLRDGDVLTIRLIGLDWADRSLSVTYRGSVGERVAFEASETRGVFVLQDGRLSAGSTEGLRALLEDVLAKTS